MLELDLWGPALRRRIPADLLHLKPQRHATGVFAADCQGQSKVGCTSDLATNLLVP